MCCCKIYNKEKMAKTKRKLNSRIENRVNLTLDKVRPYIRMHGGDVLLLDVKKGTVKLKTYGACVGCELADLTYNKILGELLRKEIPEIKKVEIV